MLRFDVSKAVSSDEARKMGETMGSEVAELLIHPERATLDDVRDMAYNIITMSIIIAKHGEGK